MDLAQLLEQLPNFGLVVGILSVLLLPFLQRVKMFVQKGWVIPIIGFFFGLFVIIVVNNALELALNYWQILLYAMLAQVAASLGYEGTKFIHTSK